MTRDKAIKELELIAEVTVWKERREAVEMAIEALQAEPIVRCKGCISKPNNTCEVDLISREDAILPSAEPKTGEWIPFNEKLPREYAQYLVCFESGECFVYWLKDSDWVRDMIEKEGAIAWMPLPMPYREGREDYELATCTDRHAVSGNARNGGIACEAPTDRRHRKVLGVGSTLTGATIEGGKHCVMHCVPCGARVRNPESVCCACADT